MSKVLHIDTSMQTDNSVSRRLSAAIVERLRATDQNLEVIYRDLDANALPHITMPVFAALAQGTDGADLSAEQQADAAESAKVLAEFLAADTIVIGAPLYNYSVPSTLRAWIDRVVVAGKTFRYTATGVEGLAAGKRAILGLARGGLYSEGSPIQQHEHAETYLRSVFALVGITDVEVIAAEGLAFGDDARDAAVQGAIEKIQAISALAA